MAPDRIDASERDQIVQVSLPLPVSGRRKCELSLIEVSGQLYYGLICVCACVTVSVVHCSCFLFVVSVSVVHVSVVHVSVVLCILSKSINIYCIT